MPLRTSFHMGSPDFSLNTFISSLPLPLWKPLVWSGFSMAPSRSAFHTCMATRGIIASTLRMYTTSHAGLRKSLLHAVAVVGAVDSLRVLSHAVMLSCSNLKLDLLICLWLKVHRCDGYHARSAG